MIALRPLDGVAFERLHRAFLEAFRDYAVPMQPNEDDLREMLTRRAFVPALSVGAFDDDRLVAFTCNGFDAPTGYDSGTGVVASHRRRHLAMAVTQASVRLLLESGARRYLLEVLESNEAAAALYRRIGFQERRRFQCWTFDGEPLVEWPDTRIEWAAGHVTEEAWDVEPSWQNSTASILRATKQAVTIRQGSSYAIVFPSTGDLPQLAVARSERRCGVGSALLRRARAIADKPLRILNVDDRDPAIAAFLLDAGATKSVRQIEMELRW